MSIECLIAATLSMFIILVIVSLMFVKCLIAVTSSMFIIWISMSDVCECIFLSPCLNIAPCASNYINEGRGNKKGCKCCGGISTGGEGVLGEGGEEYKNTDID